MTFFFTFVKGWFFCICHFCPMMDLKIWSLQCESYWSPEAVTPVQTHKLSLDWAFVVLSCTWGQSSLGYKLTHRCRESHAYGRPEKGAQASSRSPRFFCAHLFSVPETFTKPNKQTTVSNFSSPVGLDTEDLSTERTMEVGGWGEGHRW